MRVSQGPHKYVAKPPRAAAAALSQLRVLLVILLYLLYYIGCRLGEALGLQWRDVDFSAHTISVARDIDYIINGVGTLKTKASRRSIPMPAEFEAVLKPMRGFGTAFIFQAPAREASFCRKRLSGGGSGS